jgi:Carboxypeptidase regulatory-like domain
MRNPLPELTIQEISSMFKRTASFALLAMALAGMCTGAFAQTSTEGAIAGSVFDTTGAVIPGAKVTIVNQGTNDTINLTADGSGYFKAPLLEPGTYKAHVTADGFGGLDSTVLVQVGQVTNFAPHLANGGTTVQISVSADVPVLNFDGPEFASNINKQAVDNIPINNRRWSALALLTPGATVDSSGFGLIQFRGISDLLNNIEIDGADDNQAYFAEERGRTREAYSTSAAAVREFQVNSGVYPAQYGRAAGGVINSITTSGTNAIHGQAYFYDRESKFNAFNDQSTIPVVGANGAVTNDPFKPKDLRKIYGFSAGGPLMKDKLFWFYTYDQHSRIFPLSGVATNPGSVNNTTSPGFNALPDATLPGTATCNATTGVLGNASSVTDTIDAQACTLAARLKLGSYAAGVALYQSDLNALNSDQGLIPRTGYQEINTPKLDYQINNKEHLSLLFHRLRWDSPGGVQTNATGDYSLSSSGTDFVKLDYGVAKLTSLILSNLSNELLYQYSRELNDEGQQPFTPYDLNQLKQTDGDVPYLSLNTAKNGAFFGSPYYSQRPAYPLERKWQVGDSLYLSKGNNSFKFGVDIVQNDDFTNQAQYYEGDYIYTTNLANYFADLGSKGQATGTCDVNQSAAASATVNALGTYPCYNSYEQGYGPTTFDFSTLDYGFFAQDNYKVTPRLTLELGLRYDYEQTPAAYSNLIAPATLNGSNFVPYNGIGNSPNDKNNFGPRIGFSYDLYGSGRTVLRGGYGLYYGRITNGNLGTVLSSTGSPLSQSSPTLKASQGLGVVPTFGNRFTTAQENGGASAFFRAPNLQNPQVHEFDLQVQQDLGHGTVFQVSYLGALGRELPNFLDVNLNPASRQSVNVTFLDTTSKSPIPNGTVIPTTVYTKYGNTALLGPSAVNFSAITEYLSNVNSSYNALAFEVQNRSLKSLQFDASYTWSHSLDFYQNNSSAGSTQSWYDPFGNQRVNYGNSSYNTPSRFVGYALYNFPGTSGGPRALKYLTNDWSLDDTFQFQTGLPYSFGTSGSISSTAIQSGFAGSGGPAFIPQLGHNNLYYNRILVDDVRIEKQFPITERMHLQVYLQAFNVANHQNETAVNGTAYAFSGTSATAGTATYQTNFGTVNKTNNSGFSYTPRQLELATRLYF